MDGCSIFAVEKIDTTQHTQQIKLVKSTIDLNTYSMREVNYYQLGSVSPTSFKTEPIASGIMHIDLSTSEIQIYDNKRLVMLSIEKTKHIKKLIDILESGREYNATIFLKFPTSLQKKLEIVLKTYPEIKGFQMY